MAATGITVDPTLWDDSIIQTHRYTDSFQRLMESSNNTDTEKQKVLDNITCPISNQIFLEPVIAEDNRTYEKREIQNWFKKSNKSPLTMMEIGKTLRPDTEMLNRVIKFLEEYSEETDNRYYFDNSFGANVDEIKTLISSGNLDELLNYKDFDLTYMMSNSVGFSYLFTYFVRTCKKMDVIKYVLNNAIDLHTARNMANYQESVLHVILLYGNEELILYALNDLKLDINSITVNGYTPFYYLCRHGSEKSILAVIDIFDKNGIKVDYDIMDENGTFLIHDLCMRNMINAVKALIIKGININVQDMSGKTPLHYACEYLTDEICVLMIDLGADYKCLDFCGNAIINLACKHPKPITISRLLDMGVDIEIDYDVDGMQPIHYAIRKLSINHEKLVLKMISLCKDLTAPTSQGSTPLSIACQYGTFAIIMAILEKDKRLSLISTANGYSMFDYMRHNGYITAEQKINFVNSCIQADKLSNSDMRQIADAYITAYSKVKSK